MGVALSWKASSYGGTSLQGPMLKKPSLDNSYEVDNHRPIYIVMESDDNRTLMLAEGIYPQDLGCITLCIHRTIHTHGVIRVIQSMYFKQLL